MDLTKRSDLPKVLAKMEERFRLDLTDEQVHIFIYSYSHVYDAFTSLQVYIHKRIYTFHLLNFI